MTDKKWQKVYLIARHYELVLVRRPGKTCITSCFDSSYIHIMYDVDATPEDVLHEVAHYISLYLGLSPWLKVPPWVREGWRDRTLSPEWMKVADLANDKDHGLAMGKIYRDLCQLIKDDS